MSYDEECYCESNDGTQCVFCELATDARMERLAKNLAIGAALCRADRNGYDRGKKVGLLSARDAWRPGCGKDAP